MFKGFSKAILSRRIFNAYKNTSSRRIPLEQMLAGDGLQHNNSICRITTNDLKIADAYVFPDRVLLLTIVCLESTNKDNPGYVIAGVVRDETVDGKSSGHEYWLFPADHIAGGPICTLGHPELNNSTLFHGAYIPDANVWNQKNDILPYSVSLRDDYPESEVKKWGNDVLSVFRDEIWTYFEQTKSDQAD